MVTERVQKILSKAGFGSRRSCENLIKSGRVKINNEVAKLGDRAESVVDQILVDNTPIMIQKELTYIKIYKPRGVLSSNKSQGKKPTVRDLVSLPGYLYPVGRLDYDSEGLMILTNDGELTLKLTHPRYQHEKEYHVQVSAIPGDYAIECWRNGVELADGFKTAPASINIIKIVGSTTWLSIILREGHKRQIREMGKATNLRVSRIIRRRIGTITLGDLTPGTWRELTNPEIVNLRKSADLE